MPSPGWDLLQNPDRKGGDDRNKRDFLDTRSKIITVEQAAGRSVESLVVGYFDPVVAAHVSRLLALKVPVTVSLLDPPEEILPARARAELVAALSCIETVIIGDAREKVSAARTIDFTAADLQTRQELVERIRHRSQA